MPTKHQTLAVAQEQQIQFYGMRNNVVMSAGKRSCPDIICLK